MSRRRIAVVGGGLAGSTVAAALDPERFAVQLYEAEPGRSGAGSALGLWPAAARVVHQLAGPAALSDGQPTDRRAGLFRLNGTRVLGVRGSGPQMVLRPRLLEALAGAVPESVRRIEEAVDDPSSLDADLVIGADGVRSKVRALVHPSAAERRSTPYVALRGLTQTAPDPQEVGEYWGRGRIFGMVPVGPAATYWFTAHRSDLGPEPLEPTAVIDQARTVFADAAPVVRATLAAADDSTLATRLWVAPPMPRYARDRYIVIGDAAHASVPNLGRGACDAIVDAATLAAALNNGGDLRRWQARRLPFTQGARLGASGVLRVATAF